MCSINGGTRFPSLYQKRLTADPHVVEITEYGVIFISNMDFSLLRGSIMLTAADLMTTDVATVSPDATMDLAIHRLLDRGVSGLPVVDEDGRVLGIVTEFAMLAVAYDPTIRADPVRLHMTKSVIAVDETTPVLRIADLMVLHRIRRVPVTRDGRLLGLVSRRDVLRATAQCPPSSQSSSHDLARDDSRVEARS